MPRRCARNRKHWPSPGRSRRVMRSPSPASPWRSSPASSTGLRSNSESISRPRSLDSDRPRLNASAANPAFWLEEGQTVMLERVPDLIAIQYINIRVQYLSDASLSCPQVRFKYFCCPRQTFGLCVDSRALESVPSRRLCATVRDSAADRQERSSVTMASATSSKSALLPSRDSK